MAIYKNREVSILGVNNQANTPETINVSYKDGTRENVFVSGVLFTEDEKKDLIKRYPSKYEDVNTATQADIDSVRAGVAPPSDPSYKVAADLQAQKDRQAELIKQNQDAAKAEADKQAKQVDKAK